MGVFDKHYSSVFTTYRATIQIRDKIMGGTPKDPKAIEGWIKKNAGLAGDELRRLTIRTLIENGMDLSENPTDEEIDKAIGDIAALKQTNGFKRDETGLYIESRTVKAMLKESTNVVFAGHEKWGKTNKGPRNFLAERVFVNPEKIYLGVEEPTSMLMFVGHISGPKGPQSTLTYIEYVDHPRITFDVIVLGDEIKEDHWPKIWVHAQENGLGALRSQGFGRFDVEEWEKATSPKDDPAERIIASLR